MSRQRNLRAALGLLAALAAAASPAAAQRVFVAFGDSITFGYPVDPAKSYPSQLQALLAARGLADTVRNEGLDGESTAEGVSRINHALRPGDTAVLVMEGTNDINFKVSVETIASNLEQIARKAEAAGVAVVHAPVIPRLPSANTDGSNTASAALAAAVRELAWKNTRQLADPFEVYSTTADVFNLYYVMAVNNVPDKLHPNAAGYARIAEVFRDVLVNLDTVPPVPGTFTPANNATEVPALGPFSAAIYDFGQGIDLTKATLLLNGQPVTSTQTGDSRKLTLTYTPTTALLGVFTLAVRASDLNIPPNASDHTLASFITAGTTFLPGDLNRDGRVDGSDLVRMGVAFGAKAGDARFFSRADLNGDSAIDGLDFAILASNFGRSSF